MRAHSCDDYSGTVGERKKLEMMVLSTETVVGRSLRRGPEGHTSARRSALRNRMRQFKVGLWEMEKNGKD